MKNFIVLMIFAIGLMFTLPAESSGSKAPPGQSCFVVEHFDIAPAFAVVQEIAFVHQFNHLAPAAVMVQEEGGYTVEKSLNTFFDVGNKNKDVIMSKTPTYKMVDNYDFRLCFNDKTLINQSTSLKNIESHFPVTIRADSQV